MNNTKTLYCCINVFDVNPTFLLPIYKDINEEIYFTQCTEKNIIKNFEEISIEEYKQHSKIYYIDTINNYTIGDKAVFSIDYKYGFTYGSAEQIISFFRNNHSLFIDDDFISYMSDFIALNSNILLSKKNVPLSINPSYQFKSINNNFYFKTIDCRYESNNFKNAFLNWLNNLDFQYDDYDTDIFPKYRINHKENLLSNFSSKEKIIQALFKKPAIYNLWNDKIIDAYIDCNYLYHIINLNNMFPDNFFTGDSEWKNEVLPLEINNNIKKGFQIFYLNTISSNRKFNIIVAQDYKSKRNYFKLYRRINHDTIFKFSNELRQDVNSKICFILEKEPSFIIDINIRKYIDNGLLSFIFPPKSSQIYSKISRFYW